MKMKNLCLVLVILIGCQNSLGQEQDKISPERLAEILAEHAAKLPENRKSNSVSSEVLASLDAYDRSNARLDPRFFDTIRAIRNKEVFNSLEWSPEQAKKIDNAIKAVKSLEERFERDLLNPEFIREKEKIVKAIGIELINFQLKELQSARLKGGNLLEVLISSDVVGQQIELTSEQRGRIQKRSNKIGEEIRQFLIKKRKEAGEIVVEELSDKQNQKLVDLFGAKKLNESYNIVPTSNLIWNMLIGSEEREEMSDQGWRAYQFDMSTNRFWGKEK